MFHVLCISWFCVLNDGAKGYELTDCELQTANPGKDFLKDQQSTINYQPPRDI